MFRPSLDSIAATGYLQTNAESALPVLVVFNDTTPHLTTSTDLLSFCEEGGPGLGMPMDTRLLAAITLSRPDASPSGSREPRRETENARPLWRLLHLVLAAAVSLACGNTEVLFPENGVMNLGLPITVSALAMPHLRSLHPEVIQSLEGVLSQISGHPFRIRNPHLLHTPTEVAAGLIARSRRPAALDLERLHRMVVGANQHESRIDHSLTTLAALLSDSTHRHWRDRVLVPDLLVPVNENVIHRFLSAIRAAPALLAANPTIPVTETGKSSMESGRRELRVALHRRHVESIRAALAHAAGRYLNELVDGMLDPNCFLRRAISPRNTVPSTGTKRLPTFRRNADRWEVWFSQGDSVSLSHRKGLGYLHILLQSPGHVYTAVELRAILSKGPRIPVSDFDDLADERALHEYRQHLHALRAELDIATEHHDIGRVERLHPPVARDRWEVEPEGACHRT